MLKNFLKSAWTKIIGKPKAEDLGFLCCFCNEDITSLDPDPSEITIIANIDKPNEKQADQIFWCHAQCLKNKVHNDINPLFVLDDVTNKKSDS